MTSIRAKDFQERFFRRNPGLREPLQLMKAAPNASFFVKDTDCRYVLANAFHLSIYDLTREEDLVGKAASDFFPGLLAQAYHANDRRVLESCVSIRNEVWLVPHIRGLPRWFLASKSPLFDLDGEILGLARSDVHDQHAGAPTYSLPGTQSYFTKRFRKATGMGPLAYRKYLRRNQGTD